MYRANNLTVTNNSCTYHFLATDEQYVRNEDRREFQSTLWNRGNMRKFVDTGGIKTTRAEKANLGNTLNWKKRKDTVHDERMSKRVKQAPPEDLLSKPNLVPGDRDGSGKRILPIKPDTVITDKHHRSYKRWLNCWNRVQDMGEKRKKELKRKGNLSLYEKLIWPEWTPQWRKRSEDMWWWDLPGNEHRIEKFKKELVERHSRVPINMRLPDSDEDQYPTEDEFLYESDFGEPTCEFSDMD